MKYIKKGNEPDSLTEHRSQPDSTYDNYQHKDELREYLAGEQGNMWGIQADATASGKIIGN